MKWCVWQGISLTRNLDSSQRADMRAYMSLGIEDSHPLSIVLRIRDVYSGSRIRIFSITDAGYLIQGKVWYLKVFLTPKILLSSAKYDSGCSSWILDPDFFPQSRIPDLGVKKPRILVRSTAEKIHCIFLLPCRGIITAPSHAKPKVQSPPPPRHYCACVGGHICSHMCISLFFQRSTGHTS